MILEQKLSKGTFRAIDRGSKKSRNGLSAKYFNYLVRIF